MQRRHREVPHPSRRRALKEILEPLLGGNQIHGVIAKRLPMAMFPKLSHLLSAMHFPPRASRAFFRRAGRSAVTRNVDRFASPEMMSPRANSTGKVSNECNTYELNWRAISMML